VQRGCWQAQTWLGLPAPGVSLQALTSLVSAFSELHDAPVSPGAAPSGFASSRKSRRADVKEVAVRPMAQETLTLQHTWARHGAFFT